MYSDFADSNIIQIATTISFFMLSGALVIALIRLLKGPTAIDRIVTLDLVAGICLSCVTMLSISSNNSVFLNVALCIAIVAFLGTIAFVKYLERKPKL